MEKIKKRAEEYWMEPEIAISNWEDNGGLEYIKICEIDGDYIKTDTDVIVNESINSKLLDFEV